MHSGDLTWLLITTVFWSNSFSSLSSTCNPLCHLPLTIDIHAGSVAAVFTWDVTAIQGFTMNDVWHRHEPNVT
jgi:hypothetical protein